MQVTDEQKIQIVCAALTGVMANGGRIPKVSAVEAIEAAAEVIEMLEKQGIRPPEPTSNVGFA